MENINWYPGHMKKTRELIAENLKLVDAVIEVCDARIPVSSRNPILGELVRSKLRVVALNKRDLADAEATKAWISELRRGGEKAVSLNSRDGEGLNALFDALPVKRPLRVMIVGVPNSGKSSLINRLTGRKGAQTGNRPGVTKGKQWLTIEGGLRLLDTPGILWPKFEDPTVGLNLAFCGSIRDEILDSAELGLKLIELLSVGYGDMLNERYGLGEDKRIVPSVSSGIGEAGQKEPSPLSSALLTMEAIAKKRGYILPGRRIDYGRTGRVLLDEFRSGKIGRITLERP